MGVPSILGPFQEHGLGRLPFLPEADPAGTAAHLRAIRQVHLSLHSYGHTLPPDGLLQE